MADRDVPTVLSAKVNQLFNMIQNKNRPPAEPEVARPARGQVQPVLPISLLLSKVASNSQAPTAESQSSPPAASFFIKQDESLLAESSALPVAEDRPRLQEAMVDWAEKCVERAHVDRVLIDFRLEREREEPPPPNVWRAIQLKNPGLSPYRALASFLRHATVEMFAVQPDGLLVVQFVFWTDAEKALQHLAGQGTFLSPWDSDGVLMVGGAALPVLLRHVQCLLGTAGDARFSRMMSAKDLPKGTPTNRPLSPDSFYTALPLPHFLLVKYTQPAVALRTMHQLQRRLFEEFGLTVLVVPERCEPEGHRPFHTADHLSLYTQPRLWTHPRTLRSLVMVGTVSGINDTTVEVKFTPETFGVIRKTDPSGVWSAAESTNLAVGQRVRARVLATDSTEGYLCSLSDAMLLPDTEAELLAKVRRLPARDDDRLRLFEVVDGVVVEVGADDAYLKVDIGHLRDFAYLSAAGNGLQPYQLRQYAAGDALQARIHRVTLGRFPAIELATDRLDVPLRERAKTLPPLKASQVAVGQTYKGLVVRLTPEVAEVYIGSSPKFVEVPRPAGADGGGTTDPVAAWRVGDWVNCAVQAIHPLKIVGAAVSLASEVPDREAMSRKLRHLQKLALASRASKQTTTPSSRTSDNPPAPAPARPGGRPAPKGASPARRGALKVTNLAAGVGEAALAQFFRKFARDRSVFVVLSSTPGADTQTAYVRLTHESDAVTAAAQTTNRKLGTAQNSRAITVEVVNPATVEWPAPKATAPARKVIAASKPSATPTPAAAPKPKPAVAVPAPTQAAASHKRGTATAASASSVMDSFALPTPPAIPQPPPPPPPRGAGGDGEEEELADYMDFSPNPRKRARSPDSAASESEDTVSSNGSGSGTESSRSSHSSRSSSDASRSASSGPSQGRSPARSQHTGSPSAAAQSSSSGSSRSRSPLRTPPHRSPAARIVSPPEPVPRPSLTAAALASLNASVASTHPIPTPALAPAPAPAAAAVPPSEPSASADGANAAAAPTLLPAMEDEEWSVYSDASSTRHSDSSTPLRYQRLFAQRWEELRAQGRWPQ